MAVDLTSAGILASVPNIIFATKGFSSITYPAAVNQPITSAMPADSLLRFTGSLSGSQATNGDSAVLQLIAVQPDGQHSLLQSKIVRKGGSDVFEGVLAVKQNERVYISFVPGSSIESLLNSLQFALVIESLL